MKITQDIEAAKQLCVLPPHRLEEADVVRGYAQFLVERPSLLHAFMREISTLLGNPEILGALNTPLKRRITEE
jgi:hypothetical protein